MRRTLQMPQLESPSTRHLQQARGVVRAPPLSHDIHLDLTTRQGQAGKGGNQASPRTAQR